MNGSGAQLSRDLSLFDVTMIGVGAMIGAGIFVLTGEAAGVAGPALVMAFALNGLVTLSTAMVYAELGSAIPEAGGGYLWIKEGLPGANAFLAGWMSWFAHAVAGALYALGFGAFLYELLRILGIDLVALGLDLSLAKKLFGLLIAVFFAVINFRGASETGKAGNIVTVAKLVVIGWFCLFGLKFMFFPDLLFRVGEVSGGMGLDKLQPFIPEDAGWLGILSAMGITFIAFEGYEIIVQAGEEVEDPRRNIPKAVFWSLTIVVPIYMLVAFVMIGASSSGPLLEAARAVGHGVPAELTSATENWKILRYLGELGLARAATQFVPYGAVLILVGGVLSTMSALNATTFSSTRVAYAMGRDRNLPDSFGDIHPRSRTPHVALSWTAVLIGTMVAFVPITTVAAAADIMFLLLFLQVNIAVMTLRKKYGDSLAYGYQMPFYPVLPVLSIVVLLLLALFLFVHYSTAWWYALAWVGIGVLVYRFYARGRERDEVAPPVLAVRPAPRSRPSAVLVAVRNADEERTLLRLGSRIAFLLDRDLALLHAVVVPPQLPLHEWGRLAGASQPELTRARNEAEAMGLGVHTITRATHHLAPAILHTAEEIESRYLLLGWRRSRGALGRTIERVLRHSNVHLVVVEEDEDRPPQKILVALSNPDSAALALGVAAALLDETKRGAIDVLHLCQPGEAPTKRVELMDQIEKAVFEAGGVEPGSLFGKTTPIDFHVVETGRSLAAELSKRSRDYDRMILGTRHSPWLRRPFFGRRARWIGYRSRCPVVFVNPRQPKVKFEVQRFFQFFRDLEEEGRPENERDEARRPEERGAGEDVGGADSQEGEEGE